MNIGIITEQLKNYGGSEIYILECIKRWQKELAITVYTTEFNGALFKEFGIDQGRVAVKQLPKAGNSSHRFDLLESLVVIPRTWERDIGHHDLYFQYLFPAQMVRKSPSVWFAAEPLRMLYDLFHHENVDDSKIPIHVYPRLRYEKVAKSDLHVVLQIVQELDSNSKIEVLSTNSRMMEGYLETIYGRRADLIAYPGVNLPDNPPGPAKNQTALFVGRLWRHKRVELIIKALALLPRGNLVIVGEGPEKSKLQKMVEKSGLEERVTFYGNLSQQRLSQVYRSVTCGVYTPVREPFGIMPLEAASYGMPSVVTPDGGYTEILDESCADIVAPDPTRIAEALESLFCDHDRARQMGQLARQKVEGYTWDHTADNLLKLFKDKIANRRKSISNPGYRPLLGAHYYPWYGVGKIHRHWNENTEYAAVTDFPLQGCYSSDDKEVIMKHLALTETAGLDYLVINVQVSYDGPDKMDVKAIDMLFDLAAENHPKLSLCIMFSYDKADTRTIEDSLNWLEENYASRPNYFRLEAKPVLWFLISESFIGHLYQRYHKLRETTKQYHRIAASGFGYVKSLSVHYAEFFDGWSNYSPLQMSPPDTWESYWKTSYGDFLEEKKNRGIGVFTICPGYDDTGLTLPERSNSKYRKISRNNGEVYRKMQKACLSLETLPNLIVITSFNEFHENTHIEPTEKHGNQYIELTREFSDKIRSGGRSGVPDRFGDDKAGNLSTG